jgi:hypothetical protein
LIKCASATAPMMRMTKGLLCEVADAGGAPVWTLLIAIRVSIQQMGAHGQVRQCAIFRCNRAIPLAC